MKKQKRYKLIQYAVNEYNDKFKTNCKRVNMSEKAFNKLLSNYKHSTMVEWDYCCYGLYVNCWQELVAEGNWGMSQESVDKQILYAFKSSKKSIFKDKRLAIEYKSDRINIYIIMRDKGAQCDYLITLTNKTS
jgi:hypothetical protein